MPLAKTSGDQQSAPAYTTCGHDVESAYSLRWLTCLVFNGSVGLNGPTFANNFILGGNALNLKLSPSLLWPLHNLCCVVLATVYNIIVSPASTFIGW